MAKLIFGERVGKGAPLVVGCSAMILDSAGEKVLLTRRVDNERWCLPGGQLDSGESVAEACAREVREETGLRAQVGRLIGVYSDPNMLLVYPDGNRFQLISFHFAATVTGGELGLSDETTEVGFFSRAEVGGMDVMEHHRQRIADGFAGRVETVVR